VEIIQSSAAAIYLDYLMDSFGVSAPALSGGWVVATENISPEQLTQFEIGGKTSQGEADAALADFIVTSFRYDRNWSIVFHDPVAKPGDLSYEGDLQKNIIQRDDGNYFQYDAASFSMGSILDFRSYCISAFKFAYVLYSIDIVPRTSLPYRDIVGRATWICASCYDDESWLGASVGQSNLVIQDVLASQL